MVHIAQTIGMHVRERGDGTSVLEWDATEAYGFSTSSGPVIHGGMVTTILDSAMGAACWTVLTGDEVFLTADLRVEFYRSARPGLLTARGNVIKRTTRLAFCAAELFDADDRLLAGGRCTQTILQSGGPGSRPDPSSRDFDARG
jgi:uncharacterized protein (TIGR00369 family)